MAVISPLIIIQKGPFPPTVDQELDFTDMLYVGVMCVKCLLLKSVCVGVKHLLVKRKPDKTVSVSLRLYHSSVHSVSVCWTFFRYQCLLYGT